MKIITEIKTQDIWDLLVTAMEGGSNYWYMLERIKEPVKFLFQGDAPKILTYDRPLNPGGALIISDEIGLDKGEEKKVRTLNLKTIKRGLEIMSKDYPKHFGDFIAGNSDGETGDVFLQCALFGEVIYG